jgi:hypothetical protein
MLYIAIFLSVVFTSVGFIVTKNNAKYILSGYNTMSEAKRANFDIDGYLVLFKRFHIILGVSLLLGTLIISLINNNWASLYMTTFPLLAYAYLTIQGQSFTQGPDGKRIANYLTGALLLLIAAFIGYQQVNDFQSNEFVLNKDTIEIKGSYGIVIEKQDLVTCRLVNNLPPISYKRNGFAAGDYAKGSFKVKNGPTVKMFVNKKAPQFLLLNTTDGDVYYNSDALELNDLATRINEWKGQK